MGIGLSLMPTAGRGGGINFLALKKSKYQLSEKSLGWWRWSTVNLEFCFGPKLWFLTWTKLNKIWNSDILEKLTHFRNSQIEKKIAKLSSSWLVQPSSAELRFALYLIIRTHPHQPHPRIVVILIEINIVSLLAIACRLIFFNVVGVKIILLEVGDCWEEMGKIVEFLFSFQYNFLIWAGGEDTIF